MKTIDVGSDFSGVGAFDQSLRRLGINYKTVFACDMDKFARESYIANYGEPDYYPIDVYDRTIPEKSLDIYVTSPPCQSFSLAGKRNGEDDKRGVLFYNSHEFIIKNKPRYFVFENVKGLLSDNEGKTFNNWVNLLGGKSVNGNPSIFPIEDAAPYHIYHRVLNAKHYGVPQNRERIFIIGIRDDKDNVFSWPREQHLKKRLKDVLQNDVDEKYYLSNLAIKRLCHNDSGFKSNQKTEDDIASTLCAGDYKISRGMNVLKVKSNTKKGFEVAKEGDSINFSQPKSKTRRGRVGNEVAQTLDTQCNQGVIIGAIRGRGNENKQQLEINDTGVSNSLTTVQKDNVVVQLNTSKESGGNQPYKQNRIYDADYISPVLDTECGRPNYKIDYNIRRLTPRECFRLMDFPDDFKMVCSDTQNYKMAGNSICVSVLVAILNKFKL